MQLMRESLKQIFPRVHNAHAGLLMQRGLTDWEDNEKTIKHHLIDTIGKINPSPLYLLAFNRWLDATHESAHDSFASIAATVDGRLFTGLALGGTLETGATTHHTYGMPMIAGSSVKGAVRSYTEHLFAERDDEGAIQYKEVNGTHQIIIKEDKQQILDTLFGADSDDNDDSESDEPVANAGYLIWHDAWWIPMVNEKGELLTSDKYKPFVGDIVTVHHSEYYKGDKGKLDEALNMESPVPNQQVAIQGSFYFTIEGDSKWIAIAKSLLQSTIENIGLGSKGASGYGYFIHDETLTNDIAKRFEMGRPINIDDPLAAIRQVIKYLNEGQLIENLSSKKNKFFKDLTLNKDNNDDVQKVVQVVLAEHSKLVDSWASIEATNTKRAYKFIQANKAE